MAVTANSFGNRAPDDMVPASVAGCNRFRFLRTCPADSHRSGCLLDCIDGDRSDRDRYCSHWARNDGGRAAVVEVILNDLYLDIFGWVDK